MGSVSDQWYFGTLARLLVIGTYLVAKQSGLTFQKLAFYENEKILKKPILQRDIEELRVESRYRTKAEE